MSKTMLGYAIENLFTSKYKSNNDRRFVKDSYSIYADLSDAKIYKHSKKYPETYQKTVAVIQKPSVEVNALN